MEADILLSRPVQSLVCRLKRDRVEVDEVDCEHCMQTYTCIYIIIVKIVISVE